MTSDDAEGLGTKLRRNPMMLATIAAGSVLILVLLILLVRGQGGNQDRLEDAANVAESADEGEGRCASQRTYDAIKRELFRQAARVRGSDQAAFDRIATYSSLRMERPVVRSEDATLGSVGCSGLATLDLPPGVEAVGGRRSLSAEIGYIVQPAADGSGIVVMLDGADAIIVPLATLARTSAPMPQQPSPDINALVPVVPPGALPGPAEPPVGPAPSGPSYDCANASSRSEIAVCGNPELAALDRQMAAQFGQALAEADGEQRELLQRTRTRFLRYREGCRSNDCIADSYRGRMREISDIMAGRWRAPR